MKERLSNEIPFLDTKSRMQISLYFVRDLFSQSQRKLCLIWNLGGLLWDHGSVHEHRSKQELHFNCDQAGWFRNKDSRLPRFGYPFLAVESPDQITHSMFDCTGSWIIEEDYAAQPTGGDLLWTASDETFCRQNILKISLLEDSDRSQFCSHSIHSTSTQSCKLYIFDWSKSKSRK